MTGWCLIWKIVYPADTSLFFAYQFTNMNETSVILKFLIFSLRIRLHDVSLERVFEKLFQKINSPS